MKDDLPERLPETNETAPAVCMITTGFPRFEGDNAGWFVKTLADRLGRHTDLTVLVPSDRSGFAATYSSYRLRPMRYWLRSGEDFFYRGGGVPQRLKGPAGKVWKLLVFAVSAQVQVLRQARRAAIIHAQWLPNGIWGIIPRLLYNKKLVVTVRGSDMKRYREKRPDRFLADLVLRNADAVVTVNRWFRTVLRESLPGLEVRYIPNGVERVDGACVKSRDSSVFTLLFVGALTTDKGVEDLQYAFDRLVGTGRKVNMVIVGSGPLENSLRGWARAHQRRVSVTGHLPRRAVLEKMGESDLLVLPSYGEGRPNVVLEAITARLPVLATNLPGVKELVEDRLSGLLYNAGDRGSLVRLLEACLSGREPLKRYADEARRRLERQRLTWDRCTEDHLRLYRDLLENR